MYVQMSVNCSLVHLFFSPKRAMNFNLKEIQVLFALLTRTGPHVLNFLRIKFSQLCYVGAD